MVTCPPYSGMMWNGWVNIGIGRLQGFCRFGKNKSINRLNLIIDLVLDIGVMNNENIKIKKSI